MHKEAFIKYLAKKNRRPQQYYKEALNEILSGIQEQLAQGKSITFIGFGSFYTRMKKGGKHITSKQIRLWNINRCAKLLSKLVHFSNKL